MELYTKGKLKNILFIFFLSMIFIVISLIQHSNYNADNLVVFLGPQPKMETEEMFAQMVQKRRLKRINMVCHLYHANYFDTMAYNRSEINIRKVKKDHFVKDDAHRLLYCWIHKVASTSWLALFAHLTNATGILLTQKFYRMAVLQRPLSDEDLLVANVKKRYFTFLVVRHPFERLLSAYRDRINRNTTYSFAAFRHAPKILRMSRPGIDRDKIFHNRSRVLAIIPTFEEFVRYVIRYPMQEFDNHWAPYWRHCSPCSMRYDAVFKLETMTQDAKYFLHKNHLTGAQLEHLHLTNSGASKEHLRKFYSQISLSLLKALHSKYSLDFQLFGYDISEYLTYVRNDTKPAFPLNNIPVHVNDDNSDSTSDPPAE